MPLPSMLWFYDDERSSIWSLRPSACKSTLYWDAKSTRELSRSDSALARLLISRADPKNIINTYKYDPVQHPISSGCFFLLMTQTVNIMCSSAGFCRTVPGRGVTIKPQAWGRSADLGFRWIYDIKLLEWISLIFSVDIFGWVNS